MKVVMPTAKQIKNLEAHQLEIVEAFTTALKFSIVEANYGSEKAIDLQNKAFDVARKYGWDDQKDQDFSHWCLKATDVEILAAGMSHALARCR